ncbi:hypothetical protein [Halodesulfovibrio sp.]|jgi:hypothetical protein|uniref:hypothetical protein n=1 Tax=Halodesulfovibrio sp. TaxID=1912772 RepID=UPI0025DDC571|nr:hypothetical protein [Halodesulfovibrio sp.]MCT4628237.1 hypothetical protein [Halodesulfovibrio sp.]
MEHRSGLNTLSIFCRGLLGIFVAVAVLQVMTVRSTVDDTSALASSSVDAALYFAPEVFDGWCVLQGDERESIDSISYNESGWNSDWLHHECMFLLRDRRLAAFDFSYSAMKVAGQFHLRRSQHQTTYVSSNDAAGCNEKADQVLVADASSSGGNAKRLESEKSPLITVKEATASIQNVSTANQRTAREKERLRKLRAFLFWAYAARHPKAATGRVLLADETPDFTLRYDRD